MFNKIINVKATRDVISALKSRSWDVLLKGLGLIYDWKLEVSVASQSRVSKSRLNPCKLYSLDCQVFATVCESWQVLLKHRQILLQSMYSPAQWTMMVKISAHSPPARLQCCSSLRQNVELSNTSMTATEPSTRPTSSESIVKPRHPSINPLLCGHASDVTQCGWTSKWPLWPPAHSYHIIVSYQDMAAYNKCRPAAQCVLIKHMQNIKYNTISLRNVTLMCGKQERL